jgi:hypothetical protein
MKMQEVKNYYGSWAKAAVALDRSVRTLEGWNKTRIPRIVQLAIETLTKGKLKAERIN